MVGQPVSRARPVALPMLQTQPHSDRKGTQPCSSYSLSTTVSTQRVINLLQIHIPIKEISFNIYAVMLSLHYNIVAVKLIQREGCPHDQEATATCTKRIVPHRDTNPEKWVHLPSGHTVTTNTIPCNPRVSQELCRKADKQVTMPRQPIKPAT